MGQMHSPATDAAFFDRRNLIWRYGIFSWIERLSAISDFDPNDIRCRFDFNFDRL